MSGNWIAELYAKVGADVKDFKAGMRDVKTGMNQAEADVKKTKASFKGMNDMVKIVGATMTAYGVKKAADYVLELDKLGRESLRLKDSFKNLAEQHEMSTDGILASLRKASSGTVSEMSLMLEANRAMKYELVSTEEEFGKVMMAARFYGRQMGVSTLEAYQRMVNGIGKGSRQIIDDLGITGISFEQGASKAKIMSQVVDQAMREIAASGGLMEDAADKTAKSTAKMEDFKQVWAEIVATSGVVDFGLNIAINGMEGWTRFIKDWQLLEKNDVKVVKLLIEMSTGGTLLPYDQMSGLNAAVQEYQFKTNLVTKYKELNKQRGMSVQLMGSLATRVDEVAAAERRRGDYGHDDYSNAFGFSDEAIIKAKRFMIDADREIQQERDQSAKQYWDEYQARGEAAMSAIKGFVGGAFTSFDDEIRINLAGTSAAVGEAWDEQARRAEAVANDIEKTGSSPWASMFDIPQDVLQRGGETLKAYMSKIAQDIRNSPTVAELGEIGVSALVKNAKKAISDEIGQRELYMTVSKELLKDPETIAKLGQLGIDVSAAIKTNFDPASMALEQIKADQSAANTIAGDIRANSAMQYNAMEKLSTDWPEPLRSEASRIIDAVTELKNSILDVRIVDMDGDLSLMSASPASSQNVLKQLAALG